MTSSPETLTDDLARLADEPYVLFTTFRRTGDPVATPVWIARDDERLVFTTNGRSGKAKRLRNDGRVRIQACTRTGEPLDGAPVTEARAEIVTDPTGLATGIAAIVEKYGDAARRMIGSPRDAIGADRVVVRISPAPAL